MFYRTEDGQGTIHLNFGHRGGPSQCAGPRLAGDNAALGERCGRISVALCDHPAGQDLSGKPLTCDMPMCEQHRTRVGENLDHCPRHAKRSDAAAV
jgi:hypothetical protein